MGNQIIIDINILSITIEPVINAGSRRAVERNFDSLSIFNGVKGRFLKYKALKKKML